MRRDVFQAIADPTRRAILGMLMQGPLNLNTVADKFEISRPAVSKQVKILGQCGLVYIRQQGRERICEARPGKLHQVSDWLEEYRAFWTTKLDALDNYLNTLESKKKKNMEKRNDTPAGEELAFERSFRASPETVWKALTDKEKMKKWYFDLSSFKAEPGYEFQFTGGKDGRSWLHLCKVIEAIPNKKLCHSWRYDGHDGISYVTWELSAEGTGTRLRLSHAGLESFPPVADFAKDNFREGWTYIVHTSLKNYLEGSTAGSK